MVNAANAVFERNEMPLNSADIRKFMEPTKDDDTIRKFDTGATRDTTRDKLDFEAFLSPAVLVRYAQYMHECRKQSDGNLRNGDNWQKGIPIPVYMKSELRHVIDVWLHLRGLGDLAEIKDLEKCLCAVLFNTMGLLHVILKEKREGL